MLLCLKTNPGIRKQELDPLTITPWIVLMKIQQNWSGVGTVAHVLNLTWNYCCKLEIVCADGSTFVVTMPWGKIIDGELSIFFWTL
jgi:hypothetical protein